MSTKLPPRQLGERIEVLDLDHARAVARWEAHQRQQTITVRVQQGRKTVNITCTPQQAENEYQQIGREAIARKALDQ